ncbi:MAG: SUMF1/EgtB/PvdO family nonheme iron enzyme [Anaerolineae bacterium]|nr:SUMF1/EgtB/PvdO family nonheme iron enzyme [Anaerolineae bacterium]
MTRIFISYRRTDSQAFADRIYSSLAHEFGAPEVFQDVEDIPPGVDFRTFLNEAVSSCDVLLVIIGRTWADVTDAQGQKRLDDADDFVRIEVESGLKRSDMLVIPVLVDDAAMPRAASLPESLRVLTYRNAATVRHNPYYEYDINQLTRHIRAHFPLPRRPWRLAAALVVVAVAVLIGREVLNRLPGQVVDEPTPTQSVTSVTENMSTTATIQPSDTPLPEASPIAAATDQPTPIAAGLPGGTPITANRQWTVQSRTFDGVEMVLVPAGSFQMGDDDGRTQERPAHEVRFDAPFWIDRFEVSNQQFNDLEGVAGAQGRWPGPDYPRVMMLWDEARDFCEKRGARLPTEEEWEYAARGPDHRLYPWGNVFNADYVIYAANSENQPAHIGPGWRPELSASWVGAYDLSGSVWEWMRNGYYDYPNGSPRAGTHVRRGGTWLTTSEYALRATYRENEAVLRDNAIGFRCVRDFHVDDLG